MKSKWATCLAAASFALISSSAVADDSDSSSRRNDDYSATICNETGASVDVAYAWRAGDTDDSWTIAGWRNIPNGDCSKLFNGNFGRYSSAKFLFYAEDNDGYYWSGNDDRKFCVPNNKFKHILRDNYTCKDDEELVSFGLKEIMRDRPEYTLTLK
ncbi:DUF1036 domain-containing protein [uncultured Shimia sp.]|uniref:DUF1036 domain-containing protein n=1 Tax=uncultured Shimia sp. TaxID=573152 RepID=UPI00261A4BC2|nr:DUF1036 domain-containing protein [uncultured Shimia sp.]